MASAVVDLKPPKLELNGTPIDGGNGNGNSKASSCVLLQSSSLRYRDRRVRMATVARVAGIVLISVLHLVSILLLTISLALGSGGVVAAGAISVDWLALIAMAIFLLHRVKFPQREYIRPRSICCFYALSLFSGVNLIIFIARFTTEGRGLVKDFESFSKPGAAAAAILAMATIATFFALVGLYVSYTSCYIETRPRRPKPLISRPMLDWHPHPVDTPTPSLSASHSMELGHVTGKYIPGLIPPWKGGKSDSDSELQAPSSYGRPKAPKSQRSFGSAKSIWLKTSSEQPERGHGNGYYGQERWGRSVRVTPPKRVWGGVGLDGRI